MNKSRLHWHDGHISETTLDARVSEVKVPAPDGTVHTFRETNEIDADGFDVFRENPSDGDGDEGLG
jgi:hypothetical protein